MVGLSITIERIWDGEGQDPRLGSKIDGVPPPTGPPSNPPLVSHKIMNDPNLWIFGPPRVSNDARGDKIIEKISEGTFEGLEFSVKDGTKKPMASNIVSKSERLVARLIIDSKWTSAENGGKSVESLFSGWKALGEANQGLIV
jgi:hypothetical protein